MVIIEIIEDKIIPITGARTMNARGGKILSGLMEANPEAAIAAPANPPIRVCDELVGIPFHHVNKFQMMAADNPEAITVKLTASDFTIFETASATCNLKIQKARKLNPAAHITAVRGDRTLVETIVAIEFAAS
jgi:hypothetical protein